MRIGIIGSRKYGHPTAVEDYIQALPPGTVIVTGGWPSRAGGYHVVEPTAGVDRRAYRAAESAGLVTVIVNGSRTKEGHRAGLQRNPVTMDLSEALVAFWDLQSSGTKNTLSLARRAGKGILVIGPDGVQVPEWQQYLNR